MDAPCLIILLFVVFVAFVIFVLMTAPRTKIGGGSKIVDYIDYRPDLERIDKLARENKGLNDFPTIMKRINLQSEFIYATPTIETVNEISDFIKKNSKKIISVGCGRGLLEAAIQDRTGIPIMCYDGAGRDDTYCKVIKKWVPFEKMGKFDTIITTWPDIGEGYLIPTIKQCKPKYLIYIGENYNGCTGGPEFLDLLRQLKPIHEVTYYQWGGMRDFCHIYELPKKLPKLSKKYDWD